MAQKKASKAKSPVKVRDLKPSKDAKGGRRIILQRPGHNLNAGGRSLDGGSRNLDGGSRNTN
jgi:hypothetical protein